MNLQALHDLRAVGFDGLDRQAQASGDFPSGLAAYDQAQDFQLASSEVVPLASSLLAILGVP